MKGIFWNIRGLGKIGRIPAVVSRIRDNHVDIVGIVETKKESLSVGLLKSLTGYVEFDWCYLPAKGSAGGILVGCNLDKFAMSSTVLLQFSVSVFLIDKKTGFSWKLVVVYGSPYEEGDFNLVRGPSEKTYSRINHRWVDSFNDWINKWALIDLDHSNVTETNNQETLVKARLYRILVSHSWDAVFPLARVKILERPPSDHNPLLIDIGVNVFYGKKGFIFEKW
ncbi:hypothetical protein BS78_03G139500 [Paspalum vaginatum]|nr:hypothetical protein BS78_03G139500 [Paspalum vaginatum]